MPKKYSEPKPGSCIFAALKVSRRGAGVVELARLESVYRRNPIKGSNPFPSADNTNKTYQKLVKHWFTGFSLFRPSQKLSKMLNPQGTNSGVRAELRPLYPNF